jgi:hypothetical protein
LRKDSSLQAAGKSLLAALVLSAMLWSPVSYSADLPSDLTPTQQTDIERVFGCAAPATLEAKAGCIFLSFFLQADAPDKWLQQETSLDGTRWLGSTIVAGHESEDEWRRQGGAPRWNAMIFGIRRSKDFHRKIYFSDGVSPTYVWPHSERQANLISRTVTALNVDKPLAAADPLVKFALDYSLTYLETGPSSGRSWLIGPGRFVRQLREQLLIVEIGGVEDEQPKYWLSRVSLKHELTP